MQTSNLKLLLNIALLVLFVLMFSSGMMLHNALPAGSGRLTLWSLTRHQWGDVHTIIAWLFSLLLIAHLLVHSGYIIAMMTAATPAHQTLNKVVVALLVILLISCLLVPFIIQVS